MELKSYIDHEVSKNTLISAIDANQQYISRGYIDANAHQYDHYKPTIRRRKAHVPYRVMTGCITGRRSIRLDDGKIGVAFTLRTTTHHADRVIEHIVATGATMVAIMRQPKHAPISLVIAHDYVGARDVVLRLATTDDLRHDRSGLWVIRPTADGLGDYAARAKQQQSLFVIERLSTDNIATARDAKGNRIHLNRGLLMRPAQ